MGAELQSRLSAVEGGAPDDAGSDRFEGRASGERGGGDDGSDVGVDLGAPGRAKAVGHLAEDHRGAQRPLAAVVGRLDVAARQEHEQLVAAVDDHAVTEMAAIGLRGLEREQAVEVAVQTARVRLDRRVGEVGAAPTDRAGVFQEAP